MAYTFGTKVKIPTAANTTTNANPATGTISVTSDVTLVTLGMIYNALSDRTGGAPTIGGVAFTQADQIRKASTPETETELWYLTSNIPTGTVLVSIPNTPTAKAIDAFVATFKAPTGNISALDVTAGSGSVSANPSIQLITKGNGDVIVGVVASGLNAWGPTSQSGTVIYNEDVGTQGGGMQYILQPSAGVILSAWTADSDDWGSIAAAFMIDDGQRRTAQELAYIEYLTNRRQAAQLLGYIEVFRRQARAAQTFAYIEYVESVITAVNVSDAGLGNDTFEYTRTLPSGTFPDLARLLDDFNRSNLGPNWTPTIGQPAIVDNKFVGLTSGTVGNIGNEAVWNAGTFGPAVQWYITIGNLQASGTAPNNDAYISYDWLSSTGTINLNVIRVYDTFIDHLQLFAFSPIDMLYDNWTVGSTFTYPPRSSIRIGLSHQSNGYVTIYLDRGNGWEAIGSAFYNSGKFVPGTVRLFLKSSTGAGIFVPTVNLDDLYFSTIDESSIFVTGSVSELGSGIDNISQILNSLSVSDVGSGLDAATVLFEILKSIQDAASGMDNVSIQASLSTIETASGQDTLALQVSFSLGDNASGVDSPDIGVSLNVNDSVLGGDFIDLSVQLSIPDTGLGTDAISILQALLKTVQDVASAIDNVSIQASVSTSEDANGQDTLSIQVQLSLVESGTGVDSPSTAASLGITDGALGGDFLDLSASVPVSETGSGLDALFQLLASLLLSETGSGSEASQILASLSVSDSGSGTDTINVLTALLKTITDAGLGSDQVNISVALSVNDAGTGDESLSIQVNVSVADTALGTDAISVLVGVLKQVSDLAFGVDGLDIAASLNIGETSYGIDDPAIRALLDLLDSGLGSDNPDISASLTITDTASATDIINILQTMLVLIADSGAGLDAISNISASIPVAESGLGSDQIGQILASLLVTDLGTGVDVVVKFDTSTSILKIEFTLNKPRITFGVSQPTIWADLQIPKLVSSDAEPTITIELSQPMIKFLLK